MKVHRNEFPPGIAIEFEACDKAILEEGGCIVIDGLALGETEIYSAYYRTIITSPLSDRHLHRSWRDQRKRAAWIGEEEA